MKRALIIGGSILTTFLITLTSFNLVCAMQTTQKIVRNDKVTTSGPIIFNNYMKKYCSLAPPGEFLHYLFSLLISFILWLFGAPLP
jgi:predicted lipase